MVVVGPVFCRCQRWAVVQKGVGIVVVVDAIIVRLCIVGSFGFRVLRLRFVARFSRNIASEKVNNLKFELAII